jgi:hypothetical protein
MRKISLIAGLTLLFILTVRDMYEFFVTDEGVRFFTSDPIRLLYAASIGVIGGFLALVFSRFSQVVRRTIKLVALGGVAVCITCSIGLYAAGLASFTPMMTQSGMTIWVIATLVALFAAAVLVWLEFYLVWTRHETVA